MRPRRSASRRTHSLRRCGACGSRTWRQCARSSRCCSAIAPTSTTNGARSAPRSARLRTDAGMRAPVGEAMTAAGSRNEDDLARAARRAFALPAEIAEADDAAAELPLRAFGDYELLDVIGAGGMGVVYRARHRLLDREVALKIIAED